MSVTIEPIDPENVCPCEDESRSIVCHRDTLGSCPFTDHQFNCAAYHHWQRKQYWTNYTTARWLRMMRYAVALDLIAFDDRTPRAPIPADVAIHGLGTLTAEQCDRAARQWKRTPAIVRTFARLISGTTRETAEWFSEAMDCIEIGAHYEGVSIF